jgi:hypothetical protein
LAKRLNSPIGEVMRLKLSEAAEWMEAIRRSDANAEEAEN